MNCACAVCQRIAQHPCEEENGGTRAPGMSVAELAFKARPSEHRGLCVTHDALPPGAETVLFPRTMVVPLSCAFQVILGPWSFQTDCVCSFCITVRSSKIETVTSLGNSPHLTSCPPGSTALSPGDRHRKGRQSLCSDTAMD